jgi:hypothetical protein
VKPDHLQKLFEETVYRSLAEKATSDQELEKLASRLQKALPDIIDKIAAQMATRVYRRLLKTAPAMLRENRAARRDFEKRHYELWKKGLDLLESYLVVASEIGDTLNSHYRKRAARTRDYLFEALTRLHARAVQVGHEVLALLSGGFADGAHARWRTAHEIAVVANFLARHGKETAKRYLEHEAIESCKAMHEYEKHADELGCEHFSAEEISRAEALRDTLCQQYGEEFQTSYGWAAEALSNKRPTLKDIEEGSGMAHLRPYYRMASHNVHPNPKGIKFRLGLADGSDLLLAGPSNYGLADPAQCIALAILQATEPMLMTKETIDTQVMAAIMQKFVGDIADAFLQTHRAMERGNRV